MGNRDDDLFSEQEAAFQQIQQHPDLDEPLIPPGFDDAPRHLRRKRKTRSLTVTVGSAAAVVAGVVVLMDQSGSGARPKGPPPMAALATTPTPVAPAPAVKATSAVPSPSLKMAERPGDVLPTGALPKVASADGPPAEFSSLRSPAQTRAPDLKPSIDSMASQVAPPAPAVASPAAPPAVDRAPPVQVAAIAPPPAAAPQASPPAPAQVRNGPPRAEVAGLLNRAHDLVGHGDIGGARLLLERAASGDDEHALFALAETFDPAMLARWGVRGVKANPQRARELYQRAADRGVRAAQERIAALR